jgi:hypothetical protein
MEDNNYPKRGRSNYYVEIRSRKVHTEKAYVSVYAEWRGRLVLVEFLAQRYVCQGWDNETNTKTGEYMGEWRYYADSTGTGYVDNEGVNYSREKITDTARARLTDSCGYLVRAYLDSEKATRDRAEAIVREIMGEVRKDTYNPAGTLRDLTVSLHADIPRVALDALHDYYTALFDADNAAKSVRATLDIIKAGE